ncbi:hypothetical protein L3Q82_021867 [Scortum barcoo]|uniref:Uncharacterized protein n=1 Tax=Scortum barcoo TaxID=214431 RepID=A0ACB8X6M5_9TELE|nr:hypothetical protein L3Q82_021867 [Scortum barcoo]
MQGKHSTPWKVDSLSNRANVSEEDDDLLSTAEQTVEERKELKIGRRRGEKKEIEILDVRQASEKMARDIRVEPVRTRDGRQAYAPEVGQTGYEIPEIWITDQSEKKTLGVTATAGEWANVLMMPFYPTLTSCKELTSKFCVAYMGVLLRKMKKAALEESRRVGRENEEENLDDNEEESSLVHPSTQLRTNVTRLEVPTEPVRVPADGQEFREFKKIKALVRAKKDQMKRSEGHVTSQHIDRKEPARNHYERLVLEDEDDEDAHIAKSSSWVRPRPDIGPVDSGAEVSMTRRSLETKGHLKVQLVNGTLEEMPFGIWKRIVWLKGPYDLITTRDLKELQLPKRLRRSLRRRLDKLQARVVRLEPAQSKATPTNWLKQIIAQANVARFKNDCGDLGGKYVHTIEGGVHPPVRQYPLNPGAVEEMDKIVRELSALGIIREEPSPITNSPIQAVKKPESAGGGWRPVINFKALNRRTIANRASLINPQGALKTLQVKKYKSCIDLANGFFSLRLAKQSQGKTAFTHKGKAYVWQRLPQGYKNSPNVFQSAVMDVLKDLGATIYIDDVFIADDTEEEHLEKLQKVIKRLTEAGLKLNLKKCQFGQFEVTYLGFQVAADLGLSEGYKEKLEQITPPKSENDLQKILGLCNYVRDHVPHYQKYAKPLYACLKKKKEDPEGQPQAQWTWTATDQENLEKLKKAIQEAGRLEPRSLTARLVAEISCEDDDAMVRVNNEGGGMVTLWSYTLSSVEKKYPQEEKELAVLARYWGALKGACPRARNQSHHPEPGTSIPKKRNH